MTKADKITMVRVVLSPVFFLVYYIPTVVTGAGWLERVSVYILVPLFIVMELTDYFDGATARKLGEVSDFGKLFDPFGDVLTHLVMMLCFVVDGYMPPYLYVVVLMREYGMLFMRMLLVRQGVAMGARKGGKFKTVLYVAGCALSLGLESCTRLGVWEEVPGRLAAACGWLYGAGALAAVASFADYLVQYRKITEQEKKGESKKGY